ncbi:MAG: DUF4838 domain-containing protein, partial [Candidatus Gallimonas sp.]
SVSAETGVRPVFIDNGETEYKIVYSSSLSTVEMQAVSELIDLFYTGTGIVLEKATDDGAVWSETAKYICVGENGYSESAGVAADPARTGTNGYRLITQGNSVFILGGGSWGTVWGVYDFLEEQLGYHYYYADEIYFDAEKCENSVLVSLDKTEKPDWEWRLAGDGEGGNNRELRTRMRMQEANDVWATNGTISYGHTFFSPSNRNYGFVPLAKCLSSHRNWYNLGYDGAESSPTSLCFSRDPEGLCEQVLSEIVKLIETCEDMNSVNFSQLDGPYWCYCPECCKIMDRYGGSPSATQVLFMKNYLGPALAEYTAAHCPERKIVVYMYAYWTTKAPPVFTDAQIEELKMPDNCGVQYCTGFPEKSAVVDLAEYGYAEGWRKITQNFAVYDYAENFNAYLMHFDDYNKLQSNISYFHEAGGVIHYNLMAYGNLVNSDWSRLHMYLESNLLWDVDADVNELTEDFFDHYYKDAAEYMKEWFYSYRAWSVLFDTSAHGGVSLPLQQCRNYDKLAQKAFNAILKYKYSDPELYGRLYDRINLETLCYRFNLLNSYQYSIEDLKSYAVAFRNDCGYFGIQRVSEFAGLDTWYQSAGLADL